MSSGIDNLSLCELIFGGSPRRMSNVFKLFCYHINDRYYEPVISYQGLQREVHNFPYYATKIARRFNQERYLIDNGTGQYINLEGTTIDEYDCRVALMIDGSVTETSTTGTGPDGDYHGAMREEHAYITQRAIYSGYKKLHGLTNLDLCLPNGLHYMYGPCSMRCSDRTMVNMSEIDTFYMTFRRSMHLTVAVTAHMEISSSQRLRTYSGHIREMS